MARDVTEPATLENTARYSLWSSDISVVERFSVLAVSASGSHVTPWSVESCHFWAGVGCPEADDTITTPAPTSTEMSAGCSTITGAERTVSVAAVEYVVFTTLLNLARYCVWSIAIVVLAIDNVFSVAPARGVQTKVPGRSTSHCCTGKGEPTAVLVKLVDSDASAIADAGSIVIDGAYCTVNVAEFVLVDP